MISKKIYLVRHGETDYNKRGVVQGSGIDAPLNETGEEQAQAFYNAYQHINFDKIYISTLIRTEQTMKPFLQQGIVHEKLSGLNEINWGNKEGIPFTDENQAYYEHITSSWNNGKVDLRVDGGESPLDVQNRQKEALDYILGKNEEKTILICMHGRAIRIFLCLMQNRHLRFMDEYPHHNLGLYQIDYNDHGFEIVTINDTSHLEL